ncbi:class I SAM-dependent methyltransferase [Azospirillum sp.]|uniref:class I SAM-dependent methyltransferase n=1 Tax=Azospirillum sp. TaxID=34012 RepID=UPI002D475B00|nr:class I SAM-dependent methyltransferase [Azospirillum sp.]HYD69638.1 class I SAM-dependent methyltransferase [Azospirillum sp.]
MTTFKDHFSGHAGDYRAFRPVYPAGLADALADATPARDLAWDVGCGNGQLSVDLARRFARVVATDASAPQIEAATPHERVEYRVAPAESGGLPDASADLIVAAQAAHWFDLPAFYAEVRRVARPGAVLALVTYGAIEAEDEALRHALRAFHDDTLGPWWPPERAHVGTGYRSLDFPFPELPVPRLAMEARWTLPQVLGYLDTWSSVKAWIKAEGGDPVADFGREIAPLWGAPEQARPILWPLAMRLGRVER